MDDIDYKAKYEASLEKAKAYDEAKERAKKAIIDCGDNEGRKRMIYGIFPEMNPESEDEKVWQWIREHINHDGTNMFDKAVDWLEKRKEQKPEQYSPLCSTTKDKINEYIANHFITDTVVKTDVKSIVKAMEEGVRLGKESQRPVEVEQNLLVRMLKDKKAITEDIRNGVPTKTIEKERNVKFATPVDVSHTEWSKEDKQCLDTALAILENLGYDGVADNLKHLRPQPKPSWSEEDEREYNYIMSYLDTAPKGKQNHAVKWLKKRRPCPSWKPSKEQIELLEKLSNHGGHYDYQNLELKKLVTQLKKL